MDNSDKMDKIFETNLRIAAREIVRREERRKKAAAALKKLKTVLPGAAAVVILLLGALYLQRKENDKDIFSPAAGMRDERITDTAGTPSDSTSSADFELLPLDALMINPSEREIKRGGNNPEISGKYKENELPIFFGDGLIKDYYAVENEGKVYLPLGVVNELFRNTGAYTTHPFVYGEYFTASDPEGGPAISIFVSDGEHEGDMSMIPGAKHVVISKTDSGSTAGRDEALNIFVRAAVRSYVDHYGEFQFLGELPDNPSDTEILRYRITKIRSSGENDNFCFFECGGRFCVSKKTGGIYTIYTGDGISFRRFDPDDFIHAAGDSVLTEADVPPEEYDIEFRDLGDLVIIPPSGADGRTEIRLLRGDGTAAETIVYEKDEVPIFLNESLVKNLSARIEDGKVYLPEEVVGYIFGGGGDGELSSFDISEEIVRRNVRTGADINVEYWDVYMSMTYLLPGIKQVMISAVYGMPIRTAEEAAELFRGQIIQAYSILYGEFEPLYEDPGPETYDKKEYLRYIISTCGVSMENDVFYVIRFPGDGTWSYYVGKYTDNIYRVRSGDNVSVAAFDPYSPYILPYAG